MFPIRVQKIKNSLHTRGSTSGNTTATTSTPQADGNMSSSSSTKKKRTLFPSLTGKDDIEDSSDSSLTELSSDDDGDGNKDKGKAKQEDDDDEDEDDDEMEWEDVLQATIEPAAPSSALRIEGDLHLTLDGNSNEFSAKKKGASAKERQMRVLTHCMHVQFLLFHGSIRNRWLCDPELQAVLLSQVTPGIMRDVEKFHVRKGRKSDEKAASKGVTEPILKLLGVLIHWWKKKFTIDKPGMRKNGYKTLHQFRDEREGESDKFEFINGNKGPNGEDKVTLMKNQGEKIESLEEFRKMAKECRGSRDAGAMLFTALLRAIGIESRLVFSLQPLGFGLTEREIYTGAGLVKKEMKTSQKKTGHGRKGKQKIEQSSGEEESEDDSDTGGGFIREKSISSHKPKQLIFDRDLPYPIFWTEAWSPATKKWITVEPIVLTVVGSTPDLLAKFEPKGKGAANSKQVIAYVIAYSADGTAKDVTVRYLAKNSFPGKTKGSRIPVRDIPVYDYEGKVVGTHKQDWFGGAMRGYRIPVELRTEDEKKEDEELGKFIAEEKVKVPQKQQKESISYYKNNPDYVLERHMKRDEAVRPGKTHIKTFTAGRGEKAIEEKVYAKDDIVSCKTVENWWREGRTIRAREQALKRVKPRAATLNKKREIEDAKRDGETIMEGLYSADQTEIYNPPPIVDGKIPRNSFGNIDIYVPSMIPPGAVHLPLKGTGKLARRLGIDYAEAVTGFEFKNQRAVPYINGIIIASGSEDILRDAWRAEQEEIKRKSDVKREKAALALWRRFLMGLRIVKHLKDEYGDDSEDAVDVNPFTKKSHHVVEEKHQDGHVESGGFFREGDEQDSGGGFIRENLDACGGSLTNDAEGNEGGGFIRDGTNEGGGFIVDDNDTGGCFLKDDASEEAAAETTSYHSSGGSEIVLDEDSDHSLNNTSPEPLQNAAISFRDLIAQKGARGVIDPKSLLSNEEDEVEKGGEREGEEDEDYNAPTPIVRSAYFPSPVATAPDQPRGPHRKTTSTIEVQIPTKLKPPFRPAEYKEVTEVNETDGASPGSATSAEKSKEPSPPPPPRRSSKRKAAVEAGRRQSKYFASADPKDEEDEGEEPVVVRKRGGRDRGRARARGSRVER
ncbi:Rad4 transglutaminase-like domain-containing protein [Morchella snyderi]|nr:Rad4 transglutaminase-like domain-containing protein [Morchella snyderi]